MIPWENKVRSCYPFAVDPLMAPHHTQSGRVVCLSVHYGLIVLLPPTLRSHLVPVLPHHQVAATPASLLYLERISGILYLSSIPGWFFSQIAAQLISSLLSDLCSNATLTWRTSLTTLNKIATILRPPVLLTFGFTPLTQYRYIHSYLFIVGTPRKLKLIFVHCILFA